MSVSPAPDFEPSASVWGRPSFFWGFKQYMFVDDYRRFGTSSMSHILVSISPRRRPDSK